MQFKGWLQLNSWFDVYGYYCPTLTKDAVSWWQITLSEWLKWLMRDMHTSIKHNFILLTNYRNDPWKYSLYKFILLNATSYIHSHSCLCTENSNGLSHSSACSCRYDMELEREVNGVRRRVARRNDVWFTPPPRLMDRTSEGTLSTWASSQQCALGCFFGLDLGCSQI